MDWAATAHFPFASRRRVVCGGGVTHSAFNCSPAAIDPDQKSLQVIEQVAGCLAGAFR